ncbi:MAG: hypothetical protein ACRD5E_07140 [Nitrososphaeraceae archaeon]
MKKKFFDDRYAVTRTYRSNGRRYKKQWHRKKSSEKKGHVRYSSGPRWTYTYLPYKPAYYYKFMAKIRPQAEDNILSSGYTVSQTWVALCKSWNGYIIAKKNFEMQDVKRYVGQIRKLQKELGLEQIEFDDFSQEELEEIDLEFDDQAEEERYRQAIRSNYESGSNSLIT